ncbi:MAG TPA: RNA 2',3'-cyclic phosphodiesterase [Burkholderiales bacterium]
MRLFFASWPPAGVAAALARWAGEVGKACGGRATRQELIHLTLSFLGDADPVAARNLARSVRCAASSFALERSRYWAHNRIVWVGPAQTPPALAQLARSLGEEREFRAHVTLIRDARRPRALSPPPALEWPVTQFTLVNSVLGPEGPSYEMLERYGLEGAAPAR